MPVIDSSYTLSPQANGVKAMLRYEFDDGLIVKHGPIHMDTEAEIAAKTIALIPNIERSRLRRDAEVAVEDRLGIGDSGGASLADVARQYFKEAMLQRDMVDALELFNKIDAYIKAQGWTVAQVKNRLDISDAQWLAITTRYQYLQTNSAVIEAYGALVDPRGDF